MSLSRILKGLAAALVGVVAVSAAAQAKTYKVGVTQGPHEQVVEFVKAELAKKGISIEVVAFPITCCPIRR
jgi:D-methionine transport system substrate-binding protein